MMIDLNNEIWQRAEGGYKVEYDASIPLRRLEETNEPSVIAGIFDELWNELHHQGDVGLASYLAVPQIVRIGITKNLFNWDVVGLCAVIELQRHLGDNPPLPAEYIDYYKAGLTDLRLFVLANIDKDLDEDAFRTALSALAACKGSIRLAKAIMELDDDILNEFLEQF